MNTANEFRKLESEIHGLEQAIDASATVSRRTSQVSLAIGIAIVLVITCFLVLNFIHLKSELTREKFSESLSKEIASMSPTALEELQKMSQHLLPVYAAEFRKQVDTAWPAVARTLQSEADALTEGLLTHTHVTLAEVEKRTLNGLEEQILASYPNLASAAGQEELRKRLDGICQNTVTASLDGFDKLYSRDLKRVQDTLFKLDVTDSHESPTDLQKKFIHLWLQLLDQEVTEL